VIKFRIAERTNSKIAEFNEGWILLSINDVDFIGGEELFYYTTTNLDYWKEVIFEVKNNIINNESITVYYYESLDLYIDFTCVDEMVEVSLIKASNPQSMPVYENKRNIQYSIVDKTIINKTDLLNALELNRIEQGEYPWEI
jgi:hypothetical protein